MYDSCTYHGRYSVHDNPNGSFLDYWWLWYVRFVLDSREVADTCCTSANNFRCLCVYSGVANDALREATPRCFPDWQMVRKKRMFNHLEIPEPTSGPSGASFLSLSFLIFSLSGIDSLAADGTTVRWLYLSPSVAFVSHLSRMTWASHNRRQKRWTDLLRKGRVPELYGYCLILVKILLIFSYVYINM